eukprot:3202103-Heterocapsa_arctica.AAC.1
MDERRYYTSEMYRGIGMPGDDSQQDAHRMGRVQCGNWYMADLQEPELLQMHCDRQNRDGTIFSTRQRFDCGLYWQIEGGNTLGRTRCEARYWTNWQVPDPQQTGESDTAKDGGYQFKSRGSKQ